MGKPRYTRKYPTYPEIPESKKDTRKYPILFFDTPTRPEPDPLPGILSNTRPDPILKNSTRWALAARLQRFVQPWFYPRRQSAFVFTPVLTSSRRLNKFFEGGAASVVSVLPREPIYSSWADDPSLAPLPLTTPITTKH